MLKLTSSVIFTIMANTVKNKRMRELKLKGIRYLQEIWIMLSAEHVTCVILYFKDFIRVLRLGVQVQG